MARHKGAICLPWGRAGKAELKRLRRLFKHVVRKPFGMVCVSGLKKPKKQRK